MSADHVYRAVQGRQRLESLLERVPLTSDYKARKVLHIAADRGLNSVLTSTCKVQGSNHFTLFIKTANYAGIVSEQAPPVNTFTKLVNS